MREVNVRDLRQHLAKMLTRAEQGEDIVVVRNGEAIVKLVSAKPRKLFDPEELTQRRERLDVALDENPVLRARQLERY
ncbi:MAG: type II toxin-antitoxin system prevent-host-death family antitoxin [Trueperaceae bacterium]